jgi:hypothetical protein
MPESEFDEAAAARDASSWARLKHGDGHRCYSRRRLCPMCWDLDAPLTKCMSAITAAGGPIALLAGDGSAPGARMQLFSGTGELLCAWAWDFGRVIALGWAASVELVTVLEGGRVMLWSMRGVRTANFSLSELLDYGDVVQCEVFSGGLVVLTGALRLVALVDFRERSVVQLADPRLSSPPSAMAVLERGGGEADAGPLPSSREPVPCPAVLLAT